MRRTNNGKYEGSNARSFSLTPTVFSPPLASDADAPVREVMTRFVFAGRKIDELASFLTSPFFYVKNY
jgi:hypothetical protein